MQQHEWKAPFSAASKMCAQLVMRNGGGDECGLPPDHPIHDGGNMDMLIMIEHDALKELLNLCASAREGNTYRLRIAVDGGQLKVKRNEGTWTMPLGLVTTGDNAR